MLRVGTRGSALALAQTRAVLARLSEPTELVPVATAGDRGEAREDKSRWVSALEAGLLEGRIDLAVHSAKDVPSILPEGLALVGVPERDDPRDALCGVRSLATLPPGARVGTSSLRRAAQLRAARADLEVVALRGNVDTRLEKLDEHDLAAIVLALAGLRRLGRESAATGVLEPHTMVPAPGQGTLVLEGRQDDARAVAAAARLTDAAAAGALAAERALVRALDASCHTPLGAYAAPEGDGRLTLTSFAGLADGSVWVRDTVSGPASEPDELGRTAAHRLRTAGAEGILAAARTAAERAGGLPPVATPEGAPLGAGGGGSA